MPTGLWPLQYQFSYVPLRSYALIGTSKWNKVHCSISGHLLKKLAFAPCCSFFRRPQAMGRYGLFAVMLYFIFCGVTRVRSERWAPAILDMGVSCIEYEKLCDELKPCENGAKCSPTYDDEGYRCDCALGYGGKNCQDQQSEYCIDPARAVNGLLGKKYLFYSPSEDRGPLLSQPGGPIDKNFSQEGRLFLD